MGPAIEVVPLRLGTIDVDVPDATERQLHEALARHGLGPRAVRAVVLTHLH
jgi:glyoxylase-like metal-dependent hydrolase (beta-lactamase superfamily II)